jgi:hypothetical protein
VNIKEGKRYQTKADGVEVLVLTFCQLYNGGTGVSFRYTQQKQDYDFQHEVIVAPIEDFKRDFEGVK